MLGIIAMKLAIKLSPPLPPRFFLPGQLRQVVTPPLCQQTTGAKERFFHKKWQVATTIDIVRWKQDASWSKVAPSKNGGLFKTSKRGKPRSKII
ncbi:hypothetical protein I7I50_02607 [Histoplasma capsulatum G186AR]|uniref:Uncharacterized protein n=1 Tax=Ajellomyces capsulatus TaxID=5037 RepID=A0A8H7Z8C1_AJECA|nr:hypothetical protein I7I52_00730 [Histoplasma capsulatum]QSS71676.1 hypothetical protein I7I50_02607 [Histoplasma capsulatum G186AR]